VRSTHPYLASKGFPEATGMVTPDGELLIPMRDFKDYGVINSVQRIAADGSKLFLPGGKAKGSVFTIAKGAWRERWLVEGYATGLSLQMALLDLRRQAEVIVCFSAGNLKYVATLVKRPAFVMADNDESKTGEQAAEATGLPWVMPEDVGQDANDVHALKGLRAVVGLIRNVNESARSRAA
jgi:putative DNA primase/helicase